MRSIRIIFLLAFLLISHCLYSDFIVNHSQQGFFPEILLDVAYDIDSSQSISLNELSQIISSASSLSEKKYFMQSNLFFKIQS